MSKNQLLVYGAYGYTGAMICELLHQQGIKPMLAGRNPVALKEIADKYGFEHIAFDLNNKTAFEAALQNTKVFLHCAGPFIHTAKVAAELCIQTKTHYLDITGEWQVFEMLAGMSDAAQKAGVMLLPGVGFDVVPSDCLALFLKQQLPDANLLEIVLHNEGGRLSRGTKLTMGENLGEPTYYRKEGKLTEVGLAEKIKAVSIGGKSFQAMNISWGDISTAWRSTQIPNIVTYVTAPSSMIKTAQKQKYIAWLLRIKWVKNRFLRKTAENDKPMSWEKRQQAASYIWASVQNAAGKTCTALLTMPDGYLLTADTAVMSAKKVLNGEFAAGFQTPAKVYGADFILSAKGVKREKLS
ncbi:MAG: saccharopine dehydrogenase family protein [Bacteroidia bacterium]